MKNKNKKVFDKNQKLFFIIIDSFIIDLNIFRKIMNKRIIIAKNKFGKEGMKMPNLNQMELQNLRNFIGAQDTAYNKITNYADSAVAPQKKQIFNEAAKDSLSTKQKLTVFLKNN